MFAELLERAGDRGLFQALQIFTFFFPSVLVPTQLLLENFTAAKPTHRCWTPLLDNSSFVPANISLETLMTVSIPTDPKYGPSQCLRFRYLQWQLLDPKTLVTNWSTGTVEPCVDGWVYNNSTFTATIITQWDLVCHSQHLKPLGQSIYMVGILLGSTVWGLLSDRFGRKPTLIWCCLQVAVTSTSTIFAPNFLIYCGLRFLSAFALAGVIMTSTTLLVEWTLTPRRAVNMTILGCFYSLGQMSLGGLAFALRDWRALQLAVSVPFFAIFLANWWLPESARWLIITGKPDKGLQELKRVASINGREESKKTLTTEVLTAAMQKELAAAKTRQSWLDLFYMPQLRWRLFGMTVVIFSVSFSYYGLVLDLQNLGGDIFLLQVLFGAVDLLGRATTPFLLKFFSRRITIAGSECVAGFFILANVLVPQDFQTLRLVFAVLGKGSFGVTLTCFTVYKMELFPTSLRMTADGILQSAGRLGAVMGPLIRMTRSAVPLLPPLSYGIAPIASSLLFLPFPETRGLPLPDTVQSLENKKLSAPAGSNQQEVVNTESTRF